MEALCREVEPKIPPKIFVWGAVTKQSEQTRIPGIPPHVTEIVISHMTRESSRHTNKIRFSFKMAPLRGGCINSSHSFTSGNKYRSILCSFVTIYDNPFLLGVLFFESFELICAAFLYIITQTGSHVWRSLAAENDFSYSSQVHDGDTGNSSVFSCGKSGVKGTPLIAIGDLAQSKPFVECRARAHVPNVKNRFHLEDNLSLLGIQDIVSLVENYKSESLNIATAEKKKARGFFPGFGMVRLPCNN